MSAANRKRGQRAEVAVVNYLRAQGWPDARRYLSGDGRQPGDIDWHPLICLEVKDVAASAWPTWCRQAAAEAPAGTVPVVVRRERGRPVPGGWQCRIDVAALAEFSGVDASQYYNAGDLFTVDGRGWWSCVFAVVPTILRAIDHHASPRVHGNGEQG